MTHAAALLVASACVGCLASAGPEVREERSGSDDFIIEGQNAIFELAKTIVNNKEEKLQIPWWIEHDRDVGYVGDFPVKTEYIPKMSRVSLDTVRDQKGFPPWVNIGTVKLPNGQPASVPPWYREKGGKIAPEITHLNGVVSPTAELSTWQYQRLRKRGLDGWLENMVRRFTDRMVIVFSQGTTLYGGCIENALLWKYQQVIKASNTTANIVMAAEVSPYPEDLGWNYAMEDWVEERRQRVLNFFNVSEDWATTYANCSNTTHNRCNGPHPKYRYANSAFIMGPAYAIRDMMAGIRTYTDVENRYYNEYFLRHPDKVTLDFAGILSMSLNNMHKNGVLPIEIRNGTYTQEVQTFNGTMHNTKVSTKPTYTIYNKESKETSPVCFIHGDGNGFAPLKVLAQELVDRFDEMEEVFHWKYNTSNTTAPTERVQDGEASPMI